MQIHPKTKGFLKQLKKGALHRELGIVETKKIPEKKLEVAKKTATPLEKKRIQFAENAKKWNKKKTL